MTVDPPLITELRGDILALTLNRPQVHNALDAVLVAALTRAMAMAIDEAAETSVRAVLLAGAGASFCAGADLDEMRSSIDASEQDNLRAAQALARLFRVMDKCPLPVIARVQGSALGGALGLIACADIVLAEEGARFGFSEVRLGLIPAVISPYVVARIGQGQARRWFLTGERFDARTALGLGLVHEVLPAAHLDARLEEIFCALRLGGPLAQRAAKRLLRDLAAGALDDTCEETARRIADLRVSLEGQEGLKAFLEQRRPAWQR